MTPGKSTSLDLSVQSFPFRTHQMIEYCHEHEADTACFLEGESGDWNVVAIKNKHRLEEVHLDKFKVCQSKEKDGKAAFESFRKQLGNYGFIRVNKARKVMLYTHRDNLFRKGDITALKDIKILPPTKKDDVSVNEAESITECREVKAELAAVKTQLQKVEKQIQDNQSAVKTQLQNIEKQMHDNQREFMDLIYFLAGHRTGADGRHNWPVSHLNGLKRLREDNSSSESCSSSTIQAPHSVSVVTKTTITSTTPIESVAHGEQKAVSEDGTTETMDSDPSSPSLSGTNSSQEVPEGGLQYDLDSFDIGDNVPLDRFEIRRLMNDFDNGSLQTLDASSSSKPPTETTKSIPPCQAPKRMKMHKRQTSNSSHASTLSSLSTDGAFSSTSITGPRFRTNLIRKHDDDVLCGNEDFSSHPGNARHTSLVTEYRLSYAHATKGDKNNICAAIVASIKTEGGLFLERTPACGAGHPGRACWLELSEERAKEYTACALEREMRKEHSGNISSSKDNGGQGNGGQGNGGKGSEPGNEEGSKDANSKGDDSAQGGLDRPGGSASGVVDYSNGGSGTAWATAFPINIPSVDVSVNEENVIKEEELSGTEHSGDISSSKDNGGQGNGGKGSESGNGEGSNDASSKGDDSAQGGLDGSGGSASGVFDYSSGGSGAVWATSVPINVPSTDVSVNQENVIKEGEELSGTEDISNINGLSSDPTLSKLQIAEEKSLPHNSDHHVSDVLKEEHLREGNLCVSFSHISVRKYPIILGDHPVCSNGPPVTMGWRFRAETPVDVDEYESTRPERRKPWDLIMPPEKRRTILIEEAGHTEWEIREATRGAKEVKKQRHKSARGICIQEAIEATERTFRVLRINNKSRRKSRSKKHLQKDVVISSTPLGFEHRDSVAMLQSRAASKG
eukprot:CAMPEP_0197464748 /NCGR_PEP_ID=MMETSP1175-20131217/64183_1 /TAXON_ID=1003142 /ORGANISM="Triceratium dubium, Strain CCMP147" /LENGTH=905 /DNA_ID=CAMNT_0043000739 /DNA_START=212 /DNA_END=2929 /DNA_ORIENTATION=-